MSCQTETEVELKSQKVLYVIYIYIYIYIYENLTWWTYRIWLLSSHTARFVTEVFIDDRPTEGIFHSINFRWLYSFIIYHYVTHVFHVTSTFFSHIIFRFYLILRIKTNNFTYYVIVVVVVDGVFVVVVESNVWRTTSSLNINRLVFLRESMCAFCMMETESLNSGWTKVVLLNVKKWLELLYLLTDLCQHQLLTEH